MKKTLCFIIPYFGKFPNYFPLFLKTCETNREFDWIVFTDDMADYGYPLNVKRVFMTFGEFVELVKQKFVECEVDIRKSYKLCDLKPMYGFIFEEYISEYLFWGHCDVDTVLGNLSKWLNLKFLERYDKLFCLGHMTLYRNSHENNRVFKSIHNGELIYQKVLNCPDIMWFDEEWNNDININQIFLKQSKKCFQEDLSFNIAIDFNEFRRVQYVGKVNSPQSNGYIIESYKDSIFLWKEGHLYRYYKLAGELICEEFLYMHLQWRRMLFHQDILSSKAFRIVNDEFISIEDTSINLENFDLIKKHGVCWHKQRIFLYRVSNKIHKLFHGDK